MKSGATFLIGLIAVADLLGAESLANPAGSAAKPYEKKNVAVIGGGGYLGAVAYGFLQRASSLYGTGIANVKGPKAIVATAFGSLNLNGVLGKNFVLAQADESFVKLTDMTSVESIEGRLNGVDAIIMCTRFGLEKRPVTANSYEKTPNDKTMEIYMDVPRRSTVVMNSDQEYSDMVVKNVIEACQRAGVQHVVVAETESSFDSPPTASCYDLLEKSSIPFTYIRPKGKLEMVQDFTYIKGLQGELSIESRSSPSFGDISATDTFGPIAREDVALVCVHSLMSLSWDKSRVVEVSCTGPLASTSQSYATKNLRTDREWCVNSQIVGDKLLSNFQ